MSNTTPVSRGPPLGGSGPAALADRAAHGEQYTTSRGVCRGAPTARRTTASGHAGGPELDAHPRSDGLRRLRDAVLPGALTGTAHDHEVAMAQREPKAGRPTAGRTEQQRTR